MKTTLVVITGAASGIGRQLFLKFKDQNIPMILVDLDAEKLVSLAKDTVDVHLIVGSVANTDTWERVIAKGKQVHLPISHLINCAGVIRPGFITDFSLSDVDYHLDINAKGSILGTTLIGREMKIQENGHIITISSLAGLAPVSGLSLYTASKFAIRGFSLAVAAELRDFGVNVSVICPDLVDTPMLDLQLGYPEEAKLTFSGPSKVLQPEDIVNVVLNLMKKPKLQVAVPETRGLLAKIAGAWPAFAEIFRRSLEKKGEKAIKKRR